MHVQFNLWLRAMKRAFPCELPSGWERKPCFGREGGSHRVGFGKHLFRV